MDAEHVGGLSLDAERLTVHYCHGIRVFDKEYQLVGAVFGEIAGTSAASERI